MKRVSRLVVCGLDYSVYLVSREELTAISKDPEVEGYTHCSAQKIYLVQDMPPSRMRDTLLHEIAHAFFEASGIGSYLDSQVKGKPDDFQETLIRLLVPSLLRLIDDNGEKLLRY